MSKILVAYFSASGVTEKVAKSLAKAKGADIYEIAPKVKYTDADLNWMDKNSRSTLEMKDKSSRPELANHDANISAYDTIYLGFPIWWYTVPTIVNTFLESYDFKGKKVVLFATSGSSGFGSALNDLKASVDKTCDIKEGKMLNKYSEQDLINL